MNKTNRKKYLLLIIAFISCFITGCRQEPSKEPPKYYQREIARMKKEEARLLAEKEENRKYMSDRYPWRGTKSESYLRCVPCRITIEDKCLSKRIEYLTEVVHGKRKCRIKFRD